VPVPVSVGAAVSVGKQLRRQTHPLLLLLLL
jgi:hypothetical protein